MRVPPMPADEAERIAALVSCGVLDTEPEAAFDDIALLASSMCSVPIALVSIVDRSRQWFKAKVGLDLDEAPRDFSFCGHAIVHSDPLVVPDALEDPRFADNPMVTGAPFVRFYAGVPLFLDDDPFAVGTLCVIDHVPRELSAAQLEGLTTLARRASKELSLRRKLALLRLSQRPFAPENFQTAPTELPPRDKEQQLARKLAPLPVRIGAVVGDRYRVERVLGVGGMGVVAAAHDLTTRSTVAIKFMQPSALTQPQALRRFVREAQALYALDNQHIARMLDVGNVASGAPYIVMEYLEGRDLCARLSAEGPLPIADVVVLLVQACQAVQAAHAENILHRDLKPANLFETRGTDGQPVLKVLDFGISKLVSSDAFSGETALTGASGYLGSPAYMAPEQMLGASEIDARCDVWSLGVVLYELLSGQPPFEGNNVVEICARVLTCGVTPIAERRPGTPAALVRVIERCLEKEPQRRYASVLELAQALGAVPLKRTG
jgi:hypothetical protein